MNRSNQVLFLLAVILVFSLSCNEKEDDPVEPYKVAMLAEGHSFDDMAFLQSCKEGMERAQVDFELELDYDADTTTDQYIQRLRYYCSNHFDLIFAIGYMWQDAVQSEDHMFPFTSFVLVDAALSKSSTNSASILFNVDEVAYPIGFLCAYWADTHGDDNPALGYVGAMRIPQIRQFTEPFNLGAARYNDQYDRNVDTLGVYTNSFFNMALGKHLADSLINLGADVIFGVGSVTGNGALLKAKERGVWAAGMDVDQYYSFPEVSDILLSSAMKRLDNAIYDVTAAFVKDNFPGGDIYSGNLANEGVQMAPYHDFENQIPDSIKTEIENIKAGIINGTISTGWD
ncbi:MAG: BMP family ABC transporter substrate-binding protein [Bacteroidales bacterium]|nr:BMP family ABC transporter substrate-binding protein [Bacteroidales bacterium]MCF8350062.1 BMP family ABC transporter substrate-binding protein [Bacteroidales bacterium]MCF8374994.1 BMP family ABC transporter substrate-binding protein [Bacteroidales bacterium]